MVLFFFARSARVERVVYALKRTLLTFGKLFLVESDTTSTLFDAYTPPPPFEKIDNCTTLTVIVAEGEHA